MDAKSEVDQKINNTKDEPNLRKISSAKKSVLLKALLKLKQQEHIIEKTISSHFENAKIDPRILQDIQRDYHILLKEREKIFNSIKNSVEDVNEGWKAVKNVIVDLQNFGNLDVDEYKSKLHNLWQKIQEFYKKEFIDLLLEEQNALDSDLTQFNMTLPRYENCRDFKGSLLSSKNPYRINYNMESDSQDYEEVQNFSDLIAKTGHTQNWSDEDHFLFLKLRKKHKTIPALVNAIQNKCPDLSAKCIVNHEAWYKFYLKLREKQKKAVQEWRKQKDFERSIRTEKDESDIQENGNETRSPGKIKEKLSRDNVDKCEKSLVNAESEADKKRELIKKWRKEKENKRLMDEEREKLGKQSKELSENRRKARAERLKNEVLEYKKRKALEAAFSKKIPNQNVQENILKSIDMIKSFREQDKQYIEKRKKILDSKKENCFKEIQKDEKIDSSKPRVSTLLNYTKVWKEKCKINDKEESHQGLLYIKNLARMSTIKWRNQATIPENRFG